MKERPILFSAPMVRALLAGTKTQTRRVLKQEAPDDADGCCWTDIDGLNQFAWVIGDDQDIHPSAPQFPCPYGQPGDRLWVRESLGYDAEYGHFYVATAPSSLGNASGKTYLCSLFDQDGEGYSTDDRMPNRSVPSIHLPRKYSRITLEVTKVRVERLQDISEADALAEGVNVHPVHHGKPRTSLYSPVRAYADLWDEINGPESWAANPWVWAITFKRVEK